MIDSVLPQTTSKSLLTSQTKLLTNILFLDTKSNIVPLRLRVDGPSATFMEQ